MNKMIKGSIAGATGIALLMGGFGTYAVWSDSENLQSNGVTSGELDIATSAGAWDDVNTTGTPNDWAASDKLVPGDKVSYTQTFTVKASGKNMKGNITYAKPASLTGDTWTNLTHSVAVTSSSGSVVKDGTNPFKFNFTSPFGTATLTAVVTYELPASTGNQVDQNKSATLPAAAFTIAQG